jgi:hypothetical protein
MYKLTGNLTHTQTSLTSKWYMTIPALQPKTTPGTPKQDIQYSNRARSTTTGEQHQHLTQHIQTNNKAINQLQNQQVSHMSNEKLHTQVQPFLTKWTPQHMDVYLAIPEVAVECNVKLG